MSERLLTVAELGADALRAHEALRTAPAENDARVGEGERDPLLTAGDSVRISYAQARQPSIHAASQRAAGLTIPQRSGRRA
jgi:hypothetical protein